MTKYYPTYKEHRGVLAVMNEALRHPHQYLQPLIATNDKNMCFDGEIILYSSGDWKKETRNGAIKIQVKATETKKPKMEDCPIH